MRAAAPEPDLARTRALVLAHGWNSTCYQLLNPGLARWFAPEGDAVVGYRSFGGVRVAAGAPVCAAARLADVAAAFERSARAASEGVCWFGAEARLEAVYAGAPGHALVQLGAQPVWDPRHWSAVVARHASVRAQLHRARNKGVAVREWPAARAHASPALRRVLHAWLAGRGLPPLHFMVEPETLERLYDRRVLVAERDGAPVGFALLSPVPTRGGWLVEQWPRAPEAPNGTAELLIDGAMRALAADGAAFVTLGLAPLARRAERPPTADAAPLWLRALLGWLRVHGRRFYNFQGLERFKAKLDPDGWEAVFAIAAEPHFSPRTLWAIAGAFGGGSPARTVAGGLGRAIRTELRWLTG